MKYRKKPVVIEAIQWSPGVILPNEWTENGASQIIYVEQPLTGPELAIKTLEGVMTARPGDFIIKGVKGEFYPCKPDVFEATYEPV